MWQGSQIGCILATLDREWHVLPKVCSLLRGKLRPNLCCICHIIVWNGNILQECLQFKKGKLWPNLSCMLVIIVLYCKKVCRQTTAQMLCIVPTTFDIDAYYQSICSLLRGKLRPNFCYIWDIVSEIGTYNKNVSRFCRENYTQIRDICFSWQFWHR